MRHANPPPEPDELGLVEWLLFWLQLAILALLAVVGAFIAADNRPGDYTCGLALEFMSIGLAALRIKARFDGEPASWTSWTSFLLVDDWPNLIAVTVIFAIVALIGIVVAARLGHGTLYDAGLALAIVSALAVFLNLKHVFDTIDRRG